MDIMENRHNPENLAAMWFILAILFGLSSMICIGCRYGAVQIFGSIISVVAMICCLSKLYHTVDDNNLDLL